MRECVCVGMSVCVWCARMTLSVSVCVGMCVSGVCVSIYG